MSSMCRKKRIAKNVYQYPIIEAEKLLTVSIKESAYGRDKRHIEIEYIDILDIYSDTSSLEILSNIKINQGLF